MTKSHQGNVVERIVDRDLCSGCGVCAGICPGNLLCMAEVPNGDLVAQWANAPCTTDCSLCLAACPFREGVLNPRALNEALFGPEGAVAPRFHEDAGYYDGAFAGYAEVNRPTSASGGLLTWTLERLLLAGEVDRVALVACELDEASGCRILFKEARTIEEVRLGSGSFYHQVEVSALLRRIMGEPALRWAVTGVPCLCLAVRQAMERIPRSKQSVRYLLGLACGMYQNRFYTELLLAESGVDRKGVKKIEYRRKSDGAAPSDFRFRGTDNRGPGRDIAYHGLPFYLGKNAFFRVNACNFCMDVFAEGADACYMDAWLPEYMNEPRGTSLVLVRNPQIRQLFDRGRTGKSLNLEEIGIEKMIASQAGHVRRKRYLIDMRQGRKMDRSTGRPFALSDRLTWSVQRYAQRRSKEAWAAAGRSRGVRAFWSAAWDITVPIRIQEAYDRTVGRVLRLMARIRR